MDLWPASLAAGGVGENSPIYKLFTGVSRRLYRKADRILITSQMFRDYLKNNFQIPDENIGYLPQYASGQFDQLPEAAPKDTVDLMFAGNVGAAQSLNTVLEAAELLKDVPKLCWHIVGDGSELENLKQTAAEKGLSQVIFHGRKPPEEMPAYYAKADAMMVTLTDDPFIGMTLPAKVQSYMAAGKPVLAAANGEIPQVLAAAKCGFCAPAGDAKAFADAVRQFLDCPAPTVLGKNARTYYEDHFTKEKFMNTLEQALTALAHQ
jgi:glycosyltransferase involved in cell wall biosynthesis